MTMTTILCIAAVLFGAGFIAFRLLGQSKKTNDSEIVRVTRKSRAASADAE